MFGYVFSHLCCGKKLNCRDVVTGLRHRGILRSGNLIPCNANKCIVMFGEAINNYKKINSKRTTRTSTSLATALCEKKDIWCGDITTAQELFWKLQ